jgi:hypothetical protein
LKRIRPLVEDFPVSRKPAPDVIEIPAASQEMEILEKTAKEGKSTEAHGLKFQKREKQLALMRFSLAEKGGGR